MVLILSTMIKIKKGKKYFRVVITGANGEPLSTSETLNSHQACLKNIRAINENFLQMSDRIEINDQDGKNIYISNRP